MTAHGLPADIQDQALLVLRLAMRALSCPAAGILSLTSEGEVISLRTAGAVPALAVATIREIASSENGVILEPPEAGGWSIAGIPLSYGSARNDVLVACSSPGDPFDDSQIPALRDLADSACAMGVVSSSPVPRGMPGDTAGRIEAARRLNTLIGPDSAQRPRSLGLLRIDIDHLARLNTHHGWDVVDTLIAQVATRIRTAVPADSLVARYGGGSLAVITPTDLSATNTRSSVVAILKQMNAPFIVGDLEIRLSVSLGWAMYPMDGDTPDDLRSAASAALSQAVREGGGHEQRANVELTRSYRAARTLEQDLSHAVHHDGLHLTWLPTIETGSETVVAFEALSRWDRPGHGPVSPDLFVQCAEEAGLIEALDSWSMTSACRAAVGWPQPLRVCVNISPVWLSNGRLARLVEHVLQETGLAPERLQIELSEHRSFGSSRIAHQELSRVRAIGARIALDDFGAGFSSLNRLGTLPIDQIKLDRSFVQRLGGDFRVDEILGATLRLASALGVSCCAKGVETERQLAFLDAHGCDEVQGFLLGQPVGDRLMPLTA
ncbi:putative bifunctional diguanylate cyclase/phosphodiesterase [Tanticharoenia sakaeratensis]|uniref:putative bifunctional diguanylate cyclase/phosphodiesterase n=1 Tax=Tanticharoenia sakaeratensis TaxID=444053 RepID=UPI000A853AB3|nr:bifunctional diguanylate cyclase/phosphodiesterase [Tanticharoenia sakaeratensis]GBQ22673.1 sensory box/GGDEF family protein [Tanticharoenia sakaeratensis NBRC 103193]